MAWTIPVGQYGIDDVGRNFPIGRTGHSTGLPVFDVLKLFGGYWGVLFSTAFFAVRFFCDRSSNIFAIDIPWWWRRRWLNAIHLLPTLHNLAVQLDLIDVWYHQKPTLLHHTLPIDLNPTGFQQFVGLSSGMRLFEHLVQSNAAFGM